MWSFVLQFLYFLLEMNEVGLYHRALIPENVLIQSRTDGYHIKVSDFSKASKQPLGQQVSPLLSEYYNRA